MTAIRGFPILVFYKPEDADENTPYEFIGKYKYNLDKATHEPFGFMHDEDDGFGWDPEGYKPVAIKNVEVFNKYPFTLYKQNADGTYAEVKEYDSTVN